MRYCRTECIKIIREFNFDAHQNKAGELRTALWLRFPTRLAWVFGRSRPPPCAYFAVLDIRVLVSYFTALWRWPGPTLSGDALRRCLDSAAPWAASRTACIGCRHPSHGDRAGCRPLSSTGPGTRLTSSLLRPHVRRATPHSFSPPCKSAYQRSAPASLAAWWLSLWRRPGKEQTPCQKSSRQENFVAEVFAVDSVLRCRIGLLVTYSPSPTHCHLLTVTYSPSPARRHLRVTALSTYNRDAGRANERPRRKEHVAASVLLACLRHVRPQ